MEDYDSPRINLWRKKKEELNKRANERRIALQQAEEEINRRAESRDRRRMERMRHEHDLDMDEQRRLQEKDKRGKLKEKLVALSDSSRSVLLSSEIKFTEQTLALKDSQPDGTGRIAYSEGVRLRKLRKEKLQQESEEIRRQTDLAIAERHRREEILAKALIVAEDRERERKEKIRLEEEQRLHEKAKHFLKIWSKSAEERQAPLASKLRTDPLASLQAFQKAKAREKSMREAMLAAKEKLSTELEDARNKLPMPNTDEAALWKRLNEFETAEAQIIKTQDDLLSSIMHKKLMKFIMNSNSTDA